MNSKSINLRKISNKTLERCSRSARMQIPERRNNGALWETLCKKQLCHQTCTDIKKPMTVENGPPI